MDPNHTVRTRDFVDADGRLKLKRWATNEGLIDGKQHLSIELGSRPVALAHSGASGEALVSNSLLGGDIIRLAPGQGFLPHTHPGDHLLMILAGRGTITYDGRIYPTEAGQVYLIEGGVPHGVGAITEHVILAVGSPHKAVDSPDRMTPVAYQEVTAQFDRLHCLICDIAAAFPRLLHEDGCSHCPCEVCMSPDRHETGEVSEIIMRGNE